MRLTDLVLVLDAPQQASTCITVVVFNRVRDFSRIDLVLFILCVLCVTLIWSFLKGVTLKRPPPAIYPKEPFANGVCKNLQIGMTFFVSRDCQYVESHCSASLVAGLSTNTTQCEMRHTQFTAVSL